MMSRDLIINEYIIRTEYQGQRRTKVMAVYEVRDYEPRALGRVSDAVRAFGECQPGLSANVGP